MKLKLFFLILTSMIVLVGCSGDSNEENTDSEEGMGTLDSEEDNGTENKSSSDISDDGNNRDAGLIDLKNTDSGWINYDGDMIDSSEYMLTPPMEYDPSQQYEISVGVYIAYFSGDEFLNTVKYDSEGIIDQIEDADTIRVSFHNSFEERISLKEN